MCDTNLWYTLDFFNIRLYDFAVACAKNILLRLGRGEYF